MEEIQLRKVTGDIAAELAEWWGIAYDLDHAISATKELLTLIDSGVENPTFIRSLWCSVIIAYGRCFKTGCRAKLDSSIFSGLQGNPIEAHQYYLDTRDKHIAHPVNIFEVTKIGAIVDNNGAMQGIGHLHLFRICDDRQGVWQLGALATVARKHATQQIGERESKLLDLLGTRTPAELVLLPVLQTQPQGGADTAKMSRLKNS